MKHFLLIFGFLLTATVGLFSQDSDPDEGNERLPDKMNEYIQKQLKMSDDESKKFSPVFLRYFKEWRRTLRDNKNDELVRRQKVADLQLRYRSQFRDILGEARGGQVFFHQKQFIKELFELQRSKRRGEGANMKVLTF